MLKKVLAIILGFSLVGCENEIPEDIGEVKCSITSTNNQRENGALVIARGYVHLASVEVSGLKNGIQEFASTSFELPEQFFFVGDDPRQPIKVPIPHARYQQSKVKLHFYRDPYKLILRDTTYGIPSDGNGGGNPGGGDGGPGQGDGNGNGNDGGEDDPDEDESDDDGDEDDQEENDGEEEHDEEGDDDEHDDDDDNDNDDNDDDDDDNDDDDDDDDEDDDDGGRVKANGKTVNLEDFLSKAKPSIVLLGNYAVNGKNVKILAALDVDALTLAPESGLDSLVVSKSSDNSATLTLQPALIFPSINTKEFQNAFLINFRAEAVLFIHKDFNSSLHDLLIKKLSRTSKLEFVIINAN